MNKAILAISILWAVVAQAQILNVSSVERLAVPSGEGTIMQAVGISPQGSYLLLSSDTKQGLVKWDLATGGMSTLTSDAGAGSEVCISEDGSQVVYGEITYKNKRRHESVKAIDLNTNKKQTLVKQTRNLQGFTIENGTAATVTDGNVKLHAVKKGASKAMTRPVLSHHHLKLYLTQNGVTKMFAPNGADERYIWASLSPNGSRVLYYVSGHGAFVCDIDGSHVTSMGNLTAPKWWDDNTIVGMNEVDDEYHVIASSIVARSLDGQQQVLTGDDVIATYPLPCRESGKIAFSTPDGNIYLIHVK